MYKKGNAFQEQTRRGWIYGDFMPEGLSKDARAEIKIVKLDKSFTAGPHYNKTGTKLDIIWSGHAIWEVEGQEVELKAGDYLIIPPKTTTAVKKVLSDEVIVQTLKFPSVHGDKVMGYPEET